MRHVDVGLGGGGRERLGLNWSLTSRRSSRRFMLERRGPASRRRPPSACGSLGQLVGHDLDRLALAVVDEDVAVAVDDLAARRLDLDLADAVVVRLGQVLVAGQDLQVPEAEEDDPEDHERDAADDRDAQRELRRHRAPSGLCRGTSPRQLRPLDVEAAEADRAASSAALRRRAAALERVVRAARAARPGGPAAKSGRARIVLSRIVAIISRSARTETRRADVKHELHAGDTRRRSAALAASATGSGIRPWAGSRSSMKRPTK